jgi:hypothetical protein
MDANMSEKSEKEVLGQLRSRYTRAGLNYRIQLIDQGVELTGYHRKAVIRALNRIGSSPAPVMGAMNKAGRPRKYDAALLLEPLKTIWLAGQQPCGRRLKAMMIEWVPGYEAYHCSLSSGVKEQLLEASSATLDRLLKPLRAQHRRASRATAPGTMLRKEIPLRGGSWHENQPGWLEADTVFLCGGSSSGEVICVLDGTDICTTWVEMRGMYGRGQHSTVEQLADIEKNLPFRWLGLDSDNGGEFINKHVLRWCQNGRSAPIYYTRSRPYRSNDNAHVEQKNWTHVRHWFGYERHDNPEAVLLINDLTSGELRQFVNLFSPSMKLESKEPDENGKSRRKYGPAVTPYVRVLASPEVAAEKKEELRELKATLNPFALEVAIQKKLRTINQVRRAL